MTADVLVLASPRALPRVNLLPPEIHAARKARQIKVAMGGAVAVAAGVVVLLTVSAHHSVHSAQQQLDAAQQRHQALQRQVSTLSNVTLLRQQVDAAQAMRSAALGTEVQWSHYLNDLSLTIPDNVWLTNVTVAQNTGPAGGTPAGAASAVLPSGIGQITFTGVAFSHDDVATWLESLAKEKGYANPYFSNSIEGFIGPRKVVNFTSTVTVTPDAYSGRYTKQAGS